jgi:ATP-dependent Clp protease ATP-binding subunit ClpA
VPAAPAVTFCAPLVATLPLQAPEAVQVLLLALLTLQVSVITWPVVVAVGEALMLTTGVAVVPASTLDVLVLLEPDEEPERGAWLDALRPLLLAHFQAPLLARMQVVPYELLSESALEEIAQLKLAALAAHLKASQGIELEAGADCAQALAGACGRRDNGARGLDHLIRQQLLPEMAAQCQQWRLERGGMPLRIVLAAQADGRLEMMMS